MHSEQHVGILELVDTEQTVYSGGTDSELELSLDLFPQWRLWESISVAKSSLSFGSRAFTLTWGELSTFTEF